MGRRICFALLLVSLSCTQQPASAPKENKAELQQNDEVPGRFDELGIELQVPKDFERSTDRAIFVHKEKQAWLSVSHSEVPFRVVKRTYSQEALEQRNEEFVSEEELTINGRPAVLIQSRTNAADKRVIKRVLLFGIKTGTVFVTAHSREEIDQELAPVMVEALRTIRQTSAK